MITIKTIVVATALAMVVVAMIVTPESAQAQAPSGDDAPTQTVRTVTRVLPVAKLR